MVIPAPTVLVNGIPAPPGEILVPISIAHGRSRSDVQPDAPQMTIVWKSIDTAPVLGDEIQLIANIPAPGAPGTYDDPRVLYDDPRMTYSGAWVTEASRFVGTVTEADIQEYGGYPGRVRMTAISGQATLGRIKVLLTRPIETDIARMQAIASAAGWPIRIHGTAGPRLAADEIDRDALSSLHEVCESSGGLIWVDGSGGLHYGTENHRASGLPIAAIGAHAIISGLRWQQSISDLVNKAQIAYGVDGDQQITHTEDASLAEYGERFKNVRTVLADNAAADQLAQLIFARRAWPYYRIDDVVMDSEHVSGDQAAVIAAMLLQISDAVFLPIPPDPSPAGMLAEWIIEGWREEWITANRVVLQFAVSDRARFAQTTIREWEHSATKSWGDELDRGAWLDTLILQPGETR